MGSVLWFSSPCAMLFFIADKLYLINLTAFSSPPNFSFILQIKSSVRLGYVFTLASDLNFNGNL